MDDKQRRIQDSGKLDCSVNGFDFTLARMQRDTLAVYSDLVASR